MKLNTKSESIYTHEGAKAQHISPYLQLRRSVLSCLLWENTFYEDGKSIEERICELIKKVDPADVVSIAREACLKMNLRHVPLLIVSEMAQHKLHKRYVSRTLQAIINRPDSLTEFLSIYWRNGKKPLSSKIKKGLSFALQKFSEYQLAKYNRNEKIKLRDVLFLCHAKPKDKEQEILWKKLINNELQIPDTWEVALSAGKNKKETFERLMQENKLGTLAFIRNLRNMVDANTDITLIKKYSESLNVDKILPFQFIAAAKTNPSLESMIEKMLLKNLSLGKKLSGKTILLIDVSGSMDDKISQKSEMTRLDSACGLAILLREISSDILIFTFSCTTVSVPDRHGFALRDAIVTSQSRGNTNLGQAIINVEQYAHDRLIVVTDEQSHDSVKQPKNNGYMINVATNKNGVGYGKWKHIDGFSSSIIKWIMEYENLDLSSNI